MTPLAVAFSRGSLGPGVGLLEEAEAVADEVASAFVGKRGVVGVVYLGALARGSFDRYSDIDIVVFKRRGVRLGWPREREYEYRGFTIDLEVRDYERELRRKWSMEERWVYLRSRIRYDPEGLVGELLRLKVPLTPRERDTVLAEELRRAEWSLGDVSAWLHRGDLLSARYSAIVALRHLLRALAALNWEPPPPDKWLVHAALAAARRPQSLEELVSAVLTEGSIERGRAALEELRGWLLEQLGPSP